MMKSSSSRSLINEDVQDDPALSGRASNPTGPSGAICYFSGVSSDYGSIGAGSTSDCGSAPGNRYELTVSPSSRPALARCARLREE